MTARPVLALLIAAGLFAGLSARQNLLADPVAGAPGPQNVLIIYDLCTTYGQDMKTYLASTLASISPSPASIDSVSVACNSGAGFYDELAAQTGRSDLLGYCVVFDLRFNDTHTPWNMGCPANAEEKISLGAAATTDQTLFRNFLSAGGGLYLQGEHQDYSCRNDNLIGFINSVANTPLGTGAPGVGAAPSNPPAGNYQNVDGFDTDFNTLSGTMGTNFPGGMPLWALGSAQAMVTITLSAGGNSAMIMGYLPANLNTGAGRVVVSWESNTFAEPALQNATTAAVMQNLYDFLSVADCVTSPTETPTATPTGTPTATATATNTFTATATPTITPTPTPGFEFEHKTNYPNPFQYETWILYRVNREAKITVKVFTISGEKTTELKQEALPGWNRIYWDGKNDYKKKSATGIYMYSIEAVPVAGGKPEDKKIVWSKMSVLR
jgi:hypothetical protein